MKITLDHNCLIYLENSGDVAAAIRKLLVNKEYQCFVVNVGASEMRRFGVRPDNYSAFEELIARIGLAELPRLDPIGVYDVTFWDRCVFAGDRDVELYESIGAILFPESGYRGSPRDGSRNRERKALNRACDILTMWYHISYENDVFLTTDGNFVKQTKLAQLLQIGARRICRPEELES